MQNANGGPYRTGDVTRAEREYEGYQAMQSQSTEHSWTGTFILGFITFIVLSLLGVFGGQ